MATVDRSALLASMSIETPDSVDDLTGDEVAELVHDANAEDPLEAYYRGRMDLSRGEWEATALIIVFAIGGPHIEVTLGGPSAAVEGRWGGDAARCYLSGDAASMLIDTFDAEGLL